MESYNYISMLDWPDFHDKNVCTGSGYFFSAISVASKKNIIV
jgi:hypothetical protein